MFDVNRILVTRESKINFLKGLIRIAKSDGKNSVEEKNYFRQSAFAMELAKEDADYLEDFWDEKDKIEIDFANSEEKMFFLIQAIQLCWVDGGYLESEKQEMKFIASELNVSEEALEKVEEWAYEGICWDRKGEALLQLK